MLLRDFSFSLSVSLKGSKVQYEVVLEVVPFRVFFVVVILTSDDF